MNEIEELKAELKQTKLAHQMAVELGQFQAGFLARTSHELRSPLSSLMGLHQIILSDLCETPQEEREFIAQAYKSANKLLEILDDIIAVSKIEYKAIIPKLETVSLNAIFSQVQQLIYLPSAHSNIKLEILSLEPAIFVKTDFQRFTQALLMLIDVGISNMRIGKINVSASLNNEKNLVNINLEIKGAENLFQESKDLLQNTPEFTLEFLKKNSLNLKMSSGMKFLLAQTLLDSMEGNLEILEVSPDEQKESLIQLQYSLPLAFAEVLAQEL